MRAWLRIAALSSALGLSGFALAGTPAVTDPYDVAGCGETDWVGAQLGDPNGALAGIADCPGACRLAELECQKLSKLSFSCQNLIFAKRAAWSKANCKATITNDPAALRTCKLDAKSQAATDKQTVRAALHAAIAACTAWSTTCQNTCVLP